MVVRLPGRSPSPHSARPCESAARTRSVSFEAELTDAGPSVPGLRSVSLKRNLAPYPDPGPSVLIGHLAKGLQRGVFLRGFQRYVWGFKGFVWGAGRYESLGLRGNRTMGLRISGATPLATPHQQRPAPCGRRSRGRGHPSLGCGPGECGNPATPARGKCMGFVHGEDAARKSTHSS